MPGRKVLISVETGDTKKSEERGGGGVNTIVLSKKKANVPKKEGRNTIQKKSVPFVLAERKGGKVPFNSITKDWRLAAVRRCQRKRISSCSCRGEGETALGQ